MARKARVVVYVLLLALGLTLSIRASLNLTRRCGAGHRETRDLRLAVVVTHRSGDIDFFNTLLRADDIIFTYGAKPELLRKVTRPKTMFGRGSISAIEQGLERLEDGSVDYVQYNPEQWKESHTPKEETEDLLQAVRRARKLAERHGAGLGFVTDYVLLDRYGERIAPLVDIFTIQMQRFQRDGIEKFREEATRKVAIVRRGSATVPIFIAISLVPPNFNERVMPDGTIRKTHARDAKGNKVYEPIPMETVLRQMEAVKDLVDGIAFHYDEATRPELRELVSRLRR